LVEQPNVFVNKKNLASGAYPLYFLAQVFCLSSSPAIFMTTMISSKQKVTLMIYLDAHVHIQKDFAFGDLLHSARANFSRRGQATSPGKPATCFLLLAEAKTCDYFSSWKNQAATAEGLNQEGWRILPTQEEESLLAVHDHWPADRVFLLAGRQIVTAERLEVLALATVVKIADGLPLPVTVDTIRRQGGLAVLPWGVGKWLGRRGRTVAGFLADVNPDRLFVGDNGGRPVFWPTPSPFGLAAKRGIKLLPGSDPLPLAGEEQRIGSYGAMLEGECTNDTPAADLKALLTRKEMNITPVGKLLGTLSFFKTQLALRRHKG
jgi:hypothetical protein